MIIYKCIISGDEMFSDVYKVIESENGIIYEVEGKMTSRKSDDIDESVFGGNASAEEPGDSVESTTVSGVDIILNHSLQPTPFTKEAYKTYIKDYMKAVKEKLAVTNPDRVKPFMAEAPVEVKKILSNFKEYEFFTGESMSTDGMVGLLGFREDGLTPYMVFFKDGLEIEKC